MTEHKVQTLLRKQADEIYYGKELSAWKSLRKVIHQKTTSVNVLRSRTPKASHTDMMHRPRENRALSQDVSNDGEHSSVQNVISMEAAIRAQHYLRRHGWEGCSQE